METAIKVIYALMFVIIFVIGLIGADYWHKIDIAKCNSIKNNEYYYSKNNCWETYNLPLFTKILMFIIITIIPYLIWILLFMLKVKNI